MEQRDLRRLLNFQQAHEEAMALRTARLAVLAPEDLEVLQAVFAAREKGMVEPVLLGKKEKILEAAASMFLDLQGIEIIDLDSPGQMAQRGLEMFYQEEVDLVVKGRISTSHIYRAIISQEKKRGNSQRTSVCSLWELPQAGRFILLTDTGVNINPDWQIKQEVLQQAVLLMQLLGYGPITAVALTASRELEADLASRADAEKIRDHFRREGIPCQVEYGGEMRYFPGNDGEMMPDIILVPHLDAGNIIVKLDFFLDIQRSSVVTSSQGPIVVPSRSDTADHILDELALGLVIINRLQRHGGLWGG